MPMLDMQKMLDAFSASNRDVRSGYHLTLGGLIAALEIENPALPIVLDNGMEPGDFDSYRGYYSDLSIEPGANPITVGEMLTKAKAALGATFTGYKGGDFVMGEGTPLWASEYGCASGIAVTGVVLHPEKVVLSTKQIP